MSLLDIAKQPFFDLFKKEPCCPVFLRMSFHDAGTYNAADGTGGANASIFHEHGKPERPEHNGLEWALN